MPTGRFEYDLYHQLFLIYDTGLSIIMMNVHSFMLDGQKCHVAFKPKFDIDIHISSCQYVSNITLTDEANWFEKFVPRTY